MSSDAAGLSAALGEDPIVTTLPPATDYLTYLTLLEYQLKPANLSTLNRLLSEDDGKLVAEIGWDLLRLVISMLKEAPQEAQDCLQIIARRGNPREVVIRVAEELEKLGKLDDDDVDGDEAEVQEQEQELETFAGEATRIHLGQMKLDGMPEAETKKVDEASDSIQDTRLDGGNRDAEQEPMIFQALLSTLSTIHPRIRTQYPSRFLATSLPAALGAYRRVPITVRTTEDFLACLRRLAGKTRPALPPRKVTVGDSGGTAARPNSDSTAPLPDPEAAAESELGRISASENEKAIIHRLLQAVLLEVMDEYLFSLQHEDRASMHWTARLREKLEPKRVVPGRKTELERWQAQPELRARDALLRTFVSLSIELGIDPIKELQVVTGQDEATTGSFNDAEVVSEYPTSPAHVPFPTTGLIELAAASLFEPLPMPAIGELDLMLLFQLTQTLSKNPILPNSAVQDALCSILYQAVIQSEADYVGSFKLSDINFKNLMAMLTQTFTISPDPQTRDDAHHIATKFLHERSSAPERLKVIKQTVSCIYEPAKDELIPLSPPYHEGTLKAVGVDWFKDEVSVHMQRTMSRDSVKPAESPSGIDPTTLETEQELNQLLFPDVLPFDADATIDPDDTTSILLSLPFYISVLNLACVLFATNPHDTFPKTFKNAQALLESLGKWRDYLITQIPCDDAVKDSASDIFALEDACVRAKAVLARSRQ